MSLHTLPLRELAAGLRAKKFSAVELARHFLARIEAHDKRLNSFVTVCAEPALAEAAAADARLAAACFNDLVLIANRSSSADLSDEVNDLARLIVAHHLRSGTAPFTRGQTLISELMGRASVWPTEVVSDAEHAFKASLNKAKESKPNARPG